MNTNKKKLFGILMISILCILGISFYFLTNRESTSSKIETSDQIVESLDKEIISAETTANTKSNDSTITVSKQAAEANDLPLNAVTKDYILNHVDKKYTNTDKFEMANIMVVKQTIADASKLNGLKTIDDIMYSDNYGEIVYAILPSYVSVYNLSDDSDYLVAYVNTMQNSKSAEIIDYIFARNNNDGEVLDNCILDSKNGIAYIPKELYLNKNKETVVSEVQLQLLQKEDLSNMDDATTVIDATTTTDEKSTIGSRDVNIFDFNTTVRTQKNLDKDELLVSVNGIPMNEDTYSYDSKTGLVSLDQSAATIQSLDIKVAEKSFVAKVKEKFEPLTAEAAIGSATNMKSKGVIQVSDTVKAGIFWKQKYSVAYGETSGTYGSYGIGVAGAMDQQSLANLIWNGKTTGMSDGNLDYSKINQQTAFINLRVNSFSGGTATNASDKKASISVTSTKPTLYMECGHISNPLTVDYSTSTAGNWTAKNMDCVVRVLEINKTSSTPYIVIGILTPTIFTQAGVGIYRFNLKDVTLTNSIGHYLWGFEKAGNVGSGTGYLMNETSFQKKVGDKFSLTSANSIALPNGTVLGPKYGSGYSGTWKNYDYTTTHTQPSSDIWFEYDYYPIAYNITYNLNNGTNNASNPTTYTIMKETKLLSPTKTGYTFNGWQQDSTILTVANYNFTFNNSTSGNKFTSSTVQLYTNDTAKYIKEIGSSAVTGKVSYTYTHTDATNSYRIVLGAKGSTKNETIYYSNVYLEKGATYEVSYDLTTMNDSTVVINNFSMKRTSSLSSINKDKTETAMATSNYYNESFTRQKGDITLSAQWTPNTYYVKYDGNGATSGTMSNSKHTYDTAKTLTNNTYKRDGYIFNGWNTAANGSGKTFINKASVKNLTATANGTVILYAQWTPITYYIEFSDNTGIPPLPTDPFMEIQKCTYNQEYKLNKNIFTKEGYVFDSWNTEADGSGISYNDQATVKNLSTKNNEYVMLYAQWKPITYVIKYLDNGDNVQNTMSDSRHQYGISKKLNKNNYIRTGYKFICWNTEADGSGITYSDEQSILNLTMNHGDIIMLYAQWKPITYTIKYQNNSSFVMGSTASSLHTYDVDKKLTPNGFTRIGYTFSYWKSSVDTKTYLNNLSVRNLTDQDNAIIVFTPYWKANVYYIQYDGNGADAGVMSQSTHTYDVSKTLTKNKYTKTGYEFVGWNTKSDGSGTTYADSSSVRNITTKSETVKLYAQWTPITYNIKFDANGGTGNMQNMKVAYDKETQLITNNFEREDYIFKEWNTKSDGSGSKYSDQAIIYNLTNIKDETITLYAQWRPMPKVRGVNVGILKIDGESMIDDGSILEFLKNETNLVADENEDNITVIDYTISNIDEIKEAIKNAINTQEEVEIKFTIKFSNGGIGTKTVNPCILTIITTVLGDSYENSYIRYIEDDNTLKTNSKWIDGVNNRLLQEALQNKKGSDESNKTFVIKK